MLLTRFVLERLLYRLSKLPYRDRFALKGAMLMTTCFAMPFRPTRDVDLLGFGDNQPDGIATTFATCVRCPAMMVSPLIRRASPSTKFAKSSNMAASAPKRTRT